MSRQVASGETEALRGTVAYGINFLLVFSFLLPYFSASWAVRSLRDPAAGTLHVDQYAHGGAHPYRLRNRAREHGIYTFLQKLFNSYKTFVVPLASAR